MKFWSIVFLIGAAQAALLALALWRRPVNAQANRVLAVWIAVIGFDLAVKAIYFREPSADLFKLYRFVGLFPFLYGSAFYLYVRALTQGRAPGVRDGVHLLGFIAALGLHAKLFLMDPAQTQAFLDRIAAGGSWGSPWLDVALYAYSLSYVFAGLVRVRRYRGELLQRRSDADRMSLHWIDAMALSQIVIWCIAVAQWQFRIPWIDYPLIYGAVVAWVFVIGYLSLSQVAVVVQVAEPGNDAPAETIPAADDPRFAAVEARLTQLMEGEHLYSEPALTIGQLARRSGYPEYLVSAVINRRFAGNFWDYINRQRVEAARACLADAADTRTILDIAYACGFTSKSTFNAAFKRQLSVTPSAYRQAQAQASSVADAGS
ncbi:AraC family transcriptional regulator [Lysobacter sp. S4-A87]|uniref:helix-turn-helix domain-containing protein n=1 Tax=Lysobacter sp. S4-A87 TaxID=2925843 RepID=UPI001F5329F8|nr:AraC family transcriptional regulator [Lysobacter sp. S4-A87]UNK48005.1 AraC family transcriptional regulator [Lysobacter sp. S4-A87]